MKCSLEYLTFCLTPTSYPFCSSFLVSLGSKLESHLDCKHMLQRSSFAICKNEILLKLQTHASEMESKDDIPMEHIAVVLKHSGQVLSKTALVVKFLIDEVSWVYVCVRLLKPLKILHVLQMTNSLWTASLEIILSCQVMSMPVPKNSLSAE